MGSLRARQMDEILQTFMAFDYEGEQRVHADDFQKALATLGLKLGDPQVDAVMALCRIDTDTGYVDFSALPGEINRIKEDSKSRDTGFYTPSATPASGKGVEFHAALRAATGDSGMPSLPPELANLPQPARVRKLAAPLHQLFMQFDNGDMTTDVFRERMRALGLRENLEVDRLLRQDGLQFSQLFKALAMQGGNDVPLAGQAAGAKTHRTPSGGVFGTKHNAIGSPSKRAGKRTGFKDLRAASAVDPISWRNNVVDGTRVRKKKVGQYSTARNNNNSSRAAALGHERYLLKSDLQNRDTGASMSLYGRPIGSTAGTKLEDATNEGFFQGGKAGHSLPIESGAGAALWGYNQHGGYETEAQRTARGGLQKGGGPATSAGYGSRDHGLLREQIYSAIRQLDRSELDTASFRLRLKLLGCEVPAEVDRLLTEYDANGRATFKDFVRAFEKYFAARAAARATTPRNSSSNNSSNNSNNARRRSSAGGAGGAGGRGGSGSGGRYRAGGSRRTPPRRGSGSSRKTQEEQQVPKQATTGYMDRSHLTTFTQDDTPAALRTHGDILTWTNNPPITLEEHRSMVRDGVRPGQKRRTHGSRRLAAGRPCTTDDETRAPVVRASKKWTSATAMRRGAGNIIQWAGGEFKDADGKPLAAGDNMYATSLAGYGGTRGSTGGDILPDGTPSGRGRARPVTRITMKESRGEAPFGTDKDMGSPTQAFLSGSRKALIASPTLKGGDWMNHEIERDVMDHPVRTEPAPWAKPLSEYEL